MPIEKRKGESKNDFISRCISIEVEAGKEQSQAAAICYNKWSEFKVDEINSIRKQKYKEDKWIIDFFKKNNIGISIDKLGIEEKDLWNPLYQMRVDTDELENFVSVGRGINNDPSNSELDSELGTTGRHTFYKYISDEYGSKGYGPNSREFCKQLIRNGNKKVFTYEDIVALNRANPGFGVGGRDSYSVFNYRGGVNCKHKWVKYQYDADTKTIVPSFTQPTQNPVGYVNR